MRLSEQDIQQKISDALMTSEKPSTDFEAKLFAAAYEALERRRPAVKREVVLRPIRQPLSIRWVLSPAAQATALAVLVSSVFVIRTQQLGHELSFSDIPEVPKFNNAPERYDAQWQAERKAYEREVEDVQKKTSGGVDSAARGGAGDGGSTQTSEG